MNASVGVSASLAPYKDRLCSFTTSTHIDINREPVGRSVLSGRCLRWRGGGHCCLLGQPFACRRWTVGVRPLPPTPWRPRTVTASASASAVDGLRAGGEKRACLGPAERRRNAPSVGAVKRGGGGRHGEERGQGLSADKEIMRIGYFAGPVMLQPQGKAEAVFFLSSL